MITIRSGAIRSLLLAFLASWLSACATQTPAPTATPVTAVGPASAAAHTAQGTVTLPDGRSFAWVDTGHIDQFDLAESSGVGPAASSCNRWAQTGSEIFQGCARRSSKTSYVSLQAKPEEDPRTVQQLKATFPSDDDMRDKGIVEGTNSPRVLDEQRNVVVYAYLYAISRPADNDFHLIIGDEECTASACFLNVEVSAEPKSGPHKAGIRAVRAQLRELIGEDLTDGPYQHFADPILVRITGSLFFDIDHGVGDVGPACCKPDTSWEIHPIRSLEYQAD